MVILLFTLRLCATAIVPTSVKSFPASDSSRMPLLFAIASLMASIRSSTGKLKLGGEQERDVSSKSRRESKRGEKKPTS